MQSEYVFSNENWHQLFDAALIRKKSVEFVQIKSIGSSKSLFGISTSLDHAGAETRNAVRAWSKYSGRSLRLC